MNIWTVILCVVLIDAESSAIDRNFQINAMTKELVDENTRMVVGSTVDNSSSDQSTVFNTDGTTQETATTETTKISSSGSTTWSTFPRGEPPPTRSAQLGMGFGITLIGVFIMLEIIYFQCFYHGDLRSDNYLP